MQNRATKASRTTINYLVDFSIFVVFLISLNPHATGMAVHEWLGIAFGAAVLGHLLLHWQWIVNISRRLLGRVTTKARLNYLVNLLFFIVLVIVIFTGVMISQSALPALGISLGPSFIWRRVHTLASDGALVLIGVHLALHWRWVLHTTQRFLKPRRRSAPALVSTK